jgi:hypothetical protein
MQKNKIDELEDEVKEFKKYIKDTDDHLSKFLPL